MKKDWNFIDDETICNFRSAGILIQNNKILVQREKDGNEYAFPGGHVVVGETSEQSLKREYLEETGAKINIEKLIWIEECFWNWGNKEAHTVAFYYLISLEEPTAIPNDYFASQKDNCNVILEWITVEKLAQLIFYPDFAKDHMQHFPNHIKHFITDQRN